MSMFAKPDSVTRDDLETNVEGLNGLIDEQEEEIVALRARAEAAEARVAALVTAIAEMREIIRRRPGDAILRVDDRARAALAGRGDAPPTAAPLAAAERAVVNAASAYRMARLVHGPRGQYLLDRAVAGVKQSEDALFAAVDAVRAARGEATEETT